MNKAWMLLLVFPGGCYDAAERPLVDAGSNWRYDPQALHFEHVPMSVQALEMHDPRQLASVVCRSLAGELDFLGKPHLRDTRISFNCRMTGPGLAVSLDFGDLVRSP